MSLGRANEARIVLANSPQNHVLLTIAWARLALLTGDATAAIALVCDDSIEAEDMPAARVDLLLIQAIGWHRVGERASASRALRRAVGLAQTLGSSVAFTGVPRHELLDVASTDPDALAFVATELLQTTPREMYPPGLTIVDLSPRERAVLGEAWAQPDRR